MKDIHDFQKNIFMQSYDVFNDTISFIAVKPEAYLAKRLRKVAAENGETVRLRCQAEGAPIVKFSWADKEGNNISGGQSGSKYSTRTSQINTVTWESVLSINNVDEDDFGQYACTGTNEMGNDTIFLELMMKGKCIEIL